MIEMYLLAILQASENEEFRSEGNRTFIYGIYQQKDKRLTARRIAIEAIFPQQEKDDFAMKKHSFCLLIT